MKRERYRIINTVHLYYKKGTEVLLSKRQNTGFKCVFQQPININKDAVYDSITLSALSTLTEISKSGYEPIITFNNGHKTFMFKKKSNQVVS